MFTTFTMMALSGALLNHTALSANWMSDYNFARQVGTHAARPLVVFVGKGAVDWKQLTREGTFDAEVQKTLTEKYVRVYIDIDTPKGKAIAEAFGVGTRGLVISDRAGTRMAYQCVGDMPAKELARQLSRIADPNFKPTTTEIYTDAPPAAPAAQMNTYAPQTYRFGSGGGICRT